MQHTATEKENKRLLQAFDWVSSLIAALLAVVVLFTFVVRMVRVDGESMTNTLQHGDNLLLSSMPYTPCRGDIVVVYHEETQPLIKRVIAIAGDTIRIDDEAGVVYLNGKPLDEPYVRGGRTPALEFTGELTVPEGQVFAMGDNRSGSLDSRYFGAFSLEDVMGKVIYRLTPQLGKIESEYDIYEG